MPNFDYLKTIFSFLTVFRMTKFSYCICRCGYEHEHFEYISSSGEINEAMFEKVLRCILDGKCPHTDRMPEEYIKETGVSGLHVAAAVGTTDATEATPLPWHEGYDGYQGLCLSSPCSVAVIKNSKAALVPNMWSFAYVWGSYGDWIFENIDGLCVLIAETLCDEETGERIKLKIMPHLQYLVKKRNIQILKMYRCRKITPDFWFLSVLELALKSNFADVAEILLHHKNLISGLVGEEKSFPYQPVTEEVEECCKLAIVYDHPNVLDQVLEIVMREIVPIYPPHNRLASDMLQRLSKLCASIQREKYMKTVLYHECILSQSDAPIVSQSEQVTILTNLLLHYGHTEDEIVPLLKLIPYISTFKHKEGTLLHQYNSCKYTGRHDIIWAPSSEFVSSSIPSRQILTAHALPFRGTRDLAFCLMVPLDSLLVWASSGGSGETARMHRLAWTVAARIGDKYQIRLTRSIYNEVGSSLFRKILELGCSVDDVNDQGKTPLMHLLYEQITEGALTPIRRETLELYIFENPDLSRHNSVVF